MDHLLQRDRACASQLNQYQSRLQIRNGIEPFYHVRRSHLKALRNGRSKDL